MLRHDERLPAGGMAFLQAALLYTTPEGNRRVRVHTLALPVASSLGSVFRGADLDTTLQVHITSHTCPEHRISCFVSKNRLNQGMCRKQATKRLYDLLFCCSSCKYGCC